MCGIVGFLDKTGDQQAPVGQVLLSMLSALGRRGPDSAGVALYGDAGDGPLVLRVKLGAHDGVKQQAAEVCDRVSALAPVRDAARCGEYLRLVVDYAGELAALERAIEAVGDGLEVVSMGKRLEVVKQVGSPENLEAEYAISSFTGTHGLGHTRMSTESRVDLSHSQPFWAHGRPDLAVVHNGHITNYHKLRRRYEQRGHRFHTENDSEIISVYLADQMARGASFTGALESSLRDFDGSFSYLAASADSLGFVKDAFAFKPLVVTETPSYVAIATEEIALQMAFGADLRVWEPGVKQLRTWSVAERSAS
ncbi:MAG: glutamine phosphoribosylpyrophosphate amidotransferase [Candidatus Binatia bacterium]